MNILYLWSKAIKKLRGSSILNSTIHKTSKIESGSHIVNSFFDRHSFCGYDCEIVNCHVGSFSSIASKVVIGGGMHPIDWVSTSPVFYDGRDSVKTKFSVHKRIPAKKTYIGHDVWIGQGVTIKQGIQVGNGSIIGMGSVVTKNVEPYTIVAGNPARVIRPRFEIDIIQELMRVKWWEYGDQELHKYAKYFTDPRKFIEMVDK